MNLTIGGRNTATGSQALFSNTTDSDNKTAIAACMLLNNSGGSNTAIGFNALINNTSGNNNVALDVQAGENQTTGSGNVYIGANMVGVAGESNACYMRGIFAQASASGMPVLIDSDNKLGTATSSKRFKEEIKPMDRASEALFGLKPVAFRYKKEIDPKGTAQFGLVAEEVEKVNPDLVVRDKKGKPYKVRYDQGNAMLLNEFLKEHRTVQEQGTAIAQLKKEMETVVAQLTEQAAQIQKVNDQLEMSKPSPKTVSSNQVGLVH